MSEHAPPPVFLAALKSLKAAERIPGLVYKEVAAPPRLAPYSVAISVATEQTQGDQPLAVGTLVVLYDPSQSEIWGRNFRLVGHLRAQIDAEMSVDPLLNEVMWVGLLDQLDANTPGCFQAVGTVTKELSQSFGGLKLHASVLNVELRGSWSVETNLGSYLYAWASYIKQTAGLPVEEWQQPAGNLSAAREGHEMKRANLEVHNGQ